MCEKSVEKDKSTHESTESFECTRDPNMGIDFDQYATSSVDVDLQQASLVQRRVQQRKETLKTKKNQSARPSEKNRQPQENQHIT